MPYISLTGKNTCIDENGKVLSGLWRARERGRSSFDIEICRKAVMQGFTPDIISSSNVRISKMTYADFKNGRLCCNSS